MYVKNVRVPTEDVAHSPALRTPQESDYCSRSHANQDQEEEEKEEEEEEVAGPTKCSNLQCYRCGGYDVAEYIAARRTQYTALFLACIAALGWLRSTSMQAPFVMCMPCSTFMVNASTVRVGREFDGKFPMLL